MLTQKDMVEIVQSPHKTVICHPDNTLISCEDSGEVTVLILPFFGASLMLQ